MRATPAYDEHFRHRQRRRITLGNITPSPAPLSPHPFYPEVLGMTSEMGRRASTLVVSADPCLSQAWVGPRFRKKYVAISSDYALTDYEHPDWVPLGFHQPKLLLNSCHLTPSSVKLLDQALDAGDLSGISGRSSHGAGFGDPETNREVETAAINHVTAHFQSLHYTVTSKELERIGYDLLCTNGLVRAGFISHRFGVACWACRGVGDPSFVIHLCHRETLSKYVAQILTASSPKSAVT